MGSPAIITNADGYLIQQLSYDAQGNRGDPLTWESLSSNTTLPESLIDRGFTFHEHLYPFTLINMNGRVYDPLVGRFLSPDPFVQDISNSQNFNRYCYCLNNPVKYTDPTGEFFWIPIVIGAVMGGVMGAVQADMNRKPWHEGLNWGALIGGATGYLAGFAPTHWVGSTLYGAGLIAASGGGMAYVTGGNVKLAMITGAIAGSAMGIAYSEQCGNQTKGKGFQSNDNVLKDFVSQSKQQEALDYFGFKGKYDPSTLFNNDVGGGDAIVNLRTGEIFYNEGAFNSGYDRLVFAADHELIHSQNILSSKYKGVKIDSEVISNEEWSTYLRNYQRQGLYHKHGVDIIDRINSYGYQAGIYELVIKPSGSYSTKFIIQWWHFIYSIPRRW